MATLEPNEANLTILANLLRSTLSGDNKALKEAMAKLSQIESHTGYALCLLQLISLPSVTDQALKLSAAINFKNFILKNWNYDESEDKELGKPNKISELDRTTVKQYIIPLMGSQPKNIQTQLGQALAIISSVDFPAKWTNLLPELVSRLGSPEMDQKPQELLAVLEVMHSIFYRYRHELKSTRLWTEIKMVLETVCEPLNKLFLKWVARLSDAAHAQNPQTLPIIIGIVSLLLDNFFSLNSQEIAEQFEETHILALWFNNSLELLKYTNPILEPKKADQDDPTALDSLKVTICEILNLFCRKYEDQFAEFLPRYVPTIWELLTSIGDAKRFDLLVTAAVKFLTAVVKKEQFKHLFNNEAALKALCEKVIIPQLKLRDSDMEVFEFNAQEYIRIDIEGSDVDTRRRTSVDFIHGLTQHFESEISRILKGYVELLLADYEKNKKSDKAFLAKDAAMYIILALSAKKSSVMKGITETNPYVDISTFFTTQVIPELSAAPGAVHDIIITDCLKYVSVFRQQLPKEYISNLMPILIKFLSNEQMVIHTYASYAIERLLSIKDGANLRLDKEFVRPHLQKLLEGLFAVLSMDESKENEYVMKAIMRVCSVGQDAMVPFASVIIQKITAILSYVSLNPRNPKFNHSMFETIAALIKYLCKSNPALVDSFESALFPPFQQMLGMESAAEFSPYVFQLMSQLLENRSDVSAPYQAIFPNLLMPAIWSNQGNVPAVTRFLQAFMRKPTCWAQFFVNTPRFNGIIGILQELMRLRSTEAYAMDLLTSIVTDFELAHVSENLLNAIKFFLLPKLAPTAKPTPKLLKGTAVFLFAFLAKHKLQVVDSYIGQIQKGILCQMFEKLILPNLHFLQTEGEKKLATVVLTDLLANSPTFLSDPGFLALWARTTLATVKILAPKSSREVKSVLQGVVGGEAGAAAGLLGGVSLTGETEEGDPDDLLFQSEKGFSTSYAKLVFAAATDRDFIPAVTVTPVQYFAQNLEALFTKYPGQFGQALATLPAADQQVVGSFFQNNKITVR